MIISLILNTVTVGVVVFIHYEILYRMNQWLKVTGFRRRYRTVVGVIGALCAHAIEVWVFALVYYLVHHQLDRGSLGGAFSGTLMDCVYFSFTAFSTLGFGDIVPLGDLRFLAGIEALTGLVLITWSASFLFLEMQSDWRRKD
ncbi:MAG: potassium channel family protein [Pseudomonadales bacterium]|nr:potassium channel family protein [Pseudomonadales bacterium]